MGIIISDMELPKSCYDCPCHDEEWGYCNLLKQFTDGVCGRLADCPLKESEPVIHAHWEQKAYFPDGTPAWVCSRCGHPEEAKYSYCNCGARMDEENV